MRGFADVAADVMKRRKGRGLEVLAALVLLTASWHTGAAGPDMNVFGLRVGEELSIGECKVPEFAKTASCYMRDQYMPKDEYGREFGTLWLTDEQQGQNYQEDLTVANPSVTLIDGALDAITISTQGDPSSQESVLRLLTSKYGKPSSLRRRILQNAFGAKFSSYIAKWQFNNLGVNFDGGTSINNGSIEISTPKFSSTTQRADAARKKKAVPF